MVFIVRMYKIQVTSSVTEYSNNENENETQQSHEIIFLLVDFH